MKKLNVTVAAAMLILTAGVGQCTTENCVIKHITQIPAAERVNMVITRDRVASIVAAVSTSHANDNVSVNICISFLDEVQMGRNTALFKVICDLCSGDASVDFDKLQRLFEKEKITVDECAAVANGYLNRLREVVTGQEGKEGAYMRIVAIAATEHYLNNNLRASLFEEIEHRTAAQCDAHPSLMVPVAGWSEFAYPVPNMLYLIGWGVRL
ncbi:MAG: hypothetical protein LBF66_00460 [Holosporales bacterium]|jgi:hypothetical protein|nr:hypothetical protein [Holosporales bacterium]